MTVPGDTSQINQLPLQDNQEKTSGQDRLEKEKERLEPSTTQDSSKTLE
jgi:hypothetical protein